MSTAIFYPKKLAGGLEIGCKSTHFEVYRIVLLFVSEHRKSEIGPYSQQKWLPTWKQTSGTLCLVYWNISVTIKKFAHFTILRTRSFPSKNVVKIGYLRGFYSIYKKHIGVIGVLILSWICCSGLVQGVYNVVLSKKVHWWPRSWLQIDLFWCIWNSPDLWPWTQKIRCWLIFATKMTSDIKTNLWDPVPGILEHFCHNKKICPFHHFTY